MARNKLNGMNPYVVDLLSEMDITFSIVKGELSLIRGGGSEVLARGPDLPTLVVEALHSGSEFARDNAPALLLAAALSYEPEELLAVMDALFFTDDEDEDDEDEDSSEGPNFVSGS